MSKKHRPRLNNDEYEMLLAYRSSDTEDYHKFLAANGLPASSVTRVKHWQTMGGEDRFSIEYKPGSMDYMSIRKEVCDAMDKHSPRYNKVKYGVRKDPHLLVIDPADIHIGKISVEEETGYEYNSKIAVERVLEGVDGLLKKARGFDIDQILLIIGNDVLHFDNAKGTTTSGTRMDTDRMWFENFMAAKEMYVKIIEKLVTIAPIHVMYNCSNHDYQSGFMLADSLGSWFRKAKSITFDVSIRPRKYYKYGNSMIESDHGDGCSPADVPLLMATDEPVMWSETEYRYSYRHHWHHKRVSKGNGATFDNIGVTIEVLRSPSPPDSWHNRNGFVRGPHAVEAFLHSQEGGQVARFTHLFES